MASVHDIKDVEAFVRAMVPKTGLKRLNRDGREEWEELVAEGLVILYQLAETFQPHMPGYERPGSFAGYCAKFLPRKMFTAWHKLHPEHVLEGVRGEDGKVVKRYRYGEAPASLDEMMERSEEADSDIHRAVGDFVPTRS